MTGRWGLLLGLAGLGFFLYSAFHPRHPGMTGPEGQLPNAESWQPLSQTLPPSWSRTIMLVAPGQNPAVTGTPDNKDQHDLNTRSTVYLGSPANDEGNAPDNPLMGLVRTFLSSSAGLLPGMAHPRLLPATGNAPAGPTLPSGSVLHGTIMRASAGPGSQMPVFVLIPPQKSGTILLGKPLKLLGYPDGTAAGHRLRIRFVRAIFDNGLEASMSGYAIWGDREGIPVHVSRHITGNMGGSLGRDSLMLGGETLGAAGWMGNPGLGSMLAMQEASNAMYEAQNVIPQGSRQATWRLERNTPVNVVVISGFPVPGGKDTP